MKEFSEFAEPNADKKVLLILDDHTTRDTRNVPALKLVKISHVIVLVLPPHWTHKIQPVDISFNKPVSNYMAEEHSTLMILYQKKGKTISVRDILKYVHLLLKKL